MPNLLQSLAKSRAAAATSSSRARHPHSNIRTFEHSIISLLLLLAPLSLFAAPQPGEKAVPFRGQTVYVKGTKYQNFKDWEDMTLLIYGIPEGRRF